jgi:hypothetical protein
MTRRTGWILAALALLVVAAALYVVMADTPLDDVVGLAAEDGEKQLREPMRAAGGSGRVLVIALDGVGEDELLRAIRGGAAPRIAAALGAAPDGSFASAHAVAGMLSVLPSTTLAAWSSLFTGEPPAQTGVPGNEWFAREERRFYAPAPVSVEGTEDAVSVYTDGLLGSVLAVPTLYETADVRAYVALSQIHRGADLLVLPDLTILADLVGAVAAGIADDRDAVEQEAYADLDIAAVDQVLETLARHGVPDLQVVYFPGVDLYTHVAAQAVPDQLRYLSEVLDAQVGRVLDAYAAAGVLGDTWLVFVADHGHTPVLSDDRHALGTTGGGEPPDLLERIGFRMRPFELEVADDHDFQATLAYQGAIAYVYLADRSSCADEGSRCDWLLPPRLEEDVLPVVRAFDAANRTGALVPELRGTLDLIFAREPRPVGEDALPFRVWDGRALVDIGDYLAATPRPDLLALETRLHELAAGPLGHRAGDVLLLAKSGAERPIEERYYFSAEYRSWHGSPTAQDSRIPLLVARRGSSAAEIRAVVEAAVGTRPTQLDVMRLVLALLRRP